MSFKSSMSRFGAAFRPVDRQVAIRNYLNESVSIYDLERRQSEVDKGRFSTF